MRGKHGHSAATRRAIETAETSVATYQRKVAELTAENKALKARALELDQAHRAEVRRLKAERNEGVSPMLGVVQQENARLREQLDAAERTLKEIKALWNKAIQNLRDHFITDHGMLKADSLEETFAIIDGPDVRRTTILVDDNPGLSGNPDAAMLIQRARGERR